jgi:hypothetical protein
MKITKETKTITDSRGNIWHVWNECPPIPTRSFDWIAQHDNYAGESGGHVYSPTPEGLGPAITEWLDDNEPLPEPEPLSECCPTCGDSLSSKSDRAYCTDCDNDLRYNGDDSW